MNNVDTSPEKNRFKSKANPGRMSLSPFQCQARKYLTNSYPVRYNKNKRE